MIPKGWRDYKVEVRPLMILAWLLASPAVVLPLLWLWSVEWAWLGAFKWDEKTAPGWVQAAGAILALIAAVAIPAITHYFERKQRKTDELVARLMVAMELKEVFEDIAMWGRTVERAPWKNGPYYQERAQLLLARLSQLGTGSADMGVWNSVSRSESSLCSLLAILRNDGGISKGLQEFAVGELSSWMTETFRRVDELVKHAGQKAR